MGKKKLIGLTGGIGSGKTFVAKKFESLKIPVYYADKEAKRLMYRDRILKLKIKSLLGNKAYYANGRLNRAFVASKIFADKSLLKKINAVVHPAVYQDFLAWSKKQKSRYVIEESALIFESKIQDRFDKVILVTAATSTKIKRLIRRDKTNEERILKRMKNQLSDKKKIPLADYIIENNGSQIDDEILKIHNHILKLK